VYYFKSEVGGAFIWIFC